jgi:hypothetical protein
MHPMSSKVPAGKPLLQRYSWLIVLLGMVAMAPIGWSIFWYAKSHETAALLTAFIAQEARKGRIWTCPSQKITGFPYTTVITCENVDFRGEAFGKRVSGTLRGLNATSPLLRSDNVLLKLDPPFTVKSDGGDLDVTAQWSELFVQIDSAPGVLGEFAFVGSQLRLQGAALGADVTNASVGDVNGSYARSPGRRDEAYDVTVSFHEGLIPALNNFLDSNLPVSLQFEATMTPGIPSGAASLGETLEKWRAANGRFDVIFASLTSGQVDFNAKGGLDIDGEHRVEGKLDATFAGLDKALEHLGVDPALVTAGQLVAGLLGRGQESGPLKLRLSFSDGVLSVGPVRTQIELPPLY